MVVATVPGCSSASLSLESIEPDVHFPHASIEWWPNNIEVVNNRIAYPVLWVDLSVVNDTDSILVTCGDGNSVHVLDDVILPSAVPIIMHDPSAGLKIGRVRPRFRTDVERGHGTLEAAHITASDTLTYVVVDPRIPPPTGNWTFSGIEFEEGPPEMDVYPNSEGKIILNLRHPLITSYFGSRSDEAVRYVKADAGVRRLAAHLVIDCILNDISRKAWDNEQGPNANIEIGSRDPSNMDWQVYRYVMKLKARYGVSWVKTMCTVMEK